MKAKFVHTNVVARDWKLLSKFYIDVFGCKLKPPARDLRGDWLDRATGLRNATVQGVHLRLPGYGREGPTLEIFQYSKTAARSAKGINRPGFAHIAFSVESVSGALKKVVENGGSSLGEIVTTTIRGAGKIQFVYARDPEGNIIELQKWK